MTGFRAGIERNRTDDDMGSVYGGIGDWLRLKAQLEGERASIPTLRLRVCALRLCEKLFRLEKRFSQRRREQTQGRRVIQFS